MYCSKPIPLSENGSFEKIVNAGTSVARSKRRVWLRNTLRTIVVLLSVFLVNIILWMCRVIPSVPSIYITEIITCAVAFLAGRIYEVFNK